MLLLPIFQLSIYIRTVPIVKRTKFYRWNMKMDGGQSHITTAAVQTSGCSLTLYHFLATKMVHTFSSKFTISFINFMFQHSFRTRSGQKGLELKSLVIFSQKIWNEMKASHFWIKSSERDKMTFSLSSRFLLHKVCLDIDFTNTNYLPKFHFLSNDVVVDK